MWGNKSNKAAAERKHVLARLAATETAGLLNRAVELSKDEDTALAVARLRKICGPDLLSEEAAKKTIDELVVHMRNAPLNINFKAAQFFSTSKFATKYTTKFEKMTSHGAPMGDTRNLAEERMFHYSSGAGVDHGGKDKGAIAASTRVQETGALDSEKFVGSIRPKYCTVNFPALCDGVGAQWGRSHLVLAPHLKPNMSFIHSDSFDVAGGGSMLLAGKMQKVTPVRIQRVMATYHNMTRLIANMPEKMLDALCDSASGNFAAGQPWSAFNKRYSLGKTSYIEGHIHAEIYMARDLEKVRICNEEIAGSSSLRRRVRKFGSKFGVEIEYF